MAFRESPLTYTRTPRVSQSSADYASAIERPAPPTGFGRAWWVCMALIAVGAAAVLIFGSAS